MLPRTPKIYLPLIPILLAAALLTLVTQVMAASRAATPAAPATYATLDERAIFAHLAADKRLQIIVDSPTHPAGTLVAPNDDWTGGGSILTGTQLISTAWALRSVPVGAFRTSVTDTAGQDVAWEFGDIEQVLANEYHLAYNVLTETQMLNGSLDDVGILILPAFNVNYAADVVAALTPAGLTALQDFVTGGGMVYAQGTGAYLLEAAGLLVTGTVDMSATLDLPGSESLGELQIEDPAHLLTFNWEIDQLWLLHDPQVAANPPLVTVASYTNTLGGPQPAILYGESGQGRMVVVAGHPTSAIHREQLAIFFNGLLTGMSERSELYGQAIQTYDPTPGPTVIPAYEADVPISVTLCVGHYWEGATLTGAALTEQIQPGFRVDPASIGPLSATVEISSTNGMTITTLTWDLGNLAASPPCLHYTAYTERDALSPERVTFSRGGLTYADGERQVTWPHPDFMLESRMAARILGEHDKELDRFYYLPEEGVILDEFIYLENKEDSWAYDLTLTRYIPLIVPIVGLEDQREPLASNAGETVWISNTLFMFKNGDYLLPENLSSYTDTLNLDDWDGTTFVTMTTPSGYHIDPLPLNAPMVDGFFVTIPVTYAHAITVTAAGELLLPAIPVTWDLGDFPPLHWELPALRYGIQSAELFRRSVSFTGDPKVGTLVVDATGGSVYTGLGSDPLVKREFLADVLVQPPQVPITTSLSYQDIWSRTHDMPVRAGFYDLFNWASCACGPGMGERHQWLNVTFGIWVDTDNDGIRETLLTDFDALKGYMPLRVEGDLDIMIKTRNLGQPVGELENFIESRIFRGLGFSITPKGETWFDEESYTAERSELISHTVAGGYEYLTFRQSDTAPYETDSIIIHAEIDATTRQFERLLKLHDGATFGYRQAFAGPGQYEIHDTHVQGVLSARSDPNINASVNPITLSTLQDTFFLDYALSDPNEMHSAAGRGMFQDGIFFQSWGFGDAAATTYVGGRDGRELLLSLIDLGDRTWIRIEINNNTDVTWTNVIAIPLPPDGITVTQLFTENVPPPLWPDMPFLNVDAIPDTTYGIYYFELQTDESMTDLLGTILEIPIQFQADGAPANFGLPPAKLAIRAAGGAAPQYASGLTYSPEISDTLHAAVTPTLALLLTPDQMTTLEDKLAADLTTIPRGTAAISHFQSLSGTVPTLVFSFTEQQLHFDVPLTLPWIDESGNDQLAHAVVFNDFVVSRGGRYRVSEGALLSGLDDFGMVVTDTAAAQYVEARGAWLHAFYSVDGITHTLTGDPLEVLRRGEDHDVDMLITAGNSGNDIAITPTLTISYSPQITPTHYPENVSVISNTLVWETGDLAPGTDASVVVTFFVPGEATANIWQPETSMPALNWTDADFFNRLAGRWILDERIGGAFSLPMDDIPFVVMLPLISQPFAQDFTSIQIGEEFPMRPVEYQGEVFYTSTVDIPGHLPAGGHFYFSSTPDIIAEVVVDDGLFVLLNGEVDFSYDFSVEHGVPTLVIVEIPHENVASWAGQTITIEYRDMYSCVVRASDIWLIWIP